MVVERLPTGFPGATGGTGAPKMAIDPVHLMRLTALIGSTVTALAVAVLSASAATVISVGDGDTLRVEEAGRKITNRVARIDASVMAQSPHGPQARQAAPGAAAGRLHGHAEDPDQRPVRADRR